jgi:hypothetical protein
MNIQSSSANYLNLMNDRILERTMQFKNVESLLSPRPQSTLCTMLIDTILPHESCKAVILHYNSNSNSNSNFNSNSNSCNTNGKWCKYINNIDTESILKNQVYALQHAPHTKYVPDSSSDLYKLQEVKSYKNSKCAYLNTEVQPLQPIQPSPSHASSHAYSHDSSHASSHSILFNESTRQMLKNNNF